MTIHLKRLALAFGALIAPPLVGHAGQICDYEGKCYSAGPPHQTYHMDLAHPDRETPPPAPEYPRSAGQGRDIVVQPNACRLFKMRSVPNIEPLIVELCAIPESEENAIRARANNAVGADAGR